MEKGQEQKLHEIMPTGSANVEECKVPCVSVNPGDQVVFKATGHETLLMFPTHRPFGDDRYTLSADKDLTLTALDCPGRDYEYVYFLTDHHKMLEGASPPFIRIVKEPPTRNDPRR